MQILGYCRIECFETLSITFKRSHLLRVTRKGNGDNEELIGKWFKRAGKRDEIFQTHLQILVLA